MKQIKPIIYPVLTFVLLGSIYASAQSPNEYSFYASSKTYNYLSGGNPAKSPSNASFTGDEERSINYLGFKFNFCNSEYGQTCASTNGWMSFISPTDPGSHEYFDNTSAYANDVNVISPSLMPFFDDMYGRSSASASYLTTGTGRNHVFTFEWKNWGFYSGSVDNAISMQVKLYEYGAIEYLYKQETNSAPAYPNVADGLGATIGFALSTTSGAYQTLNNLSSAPTSSSSTFYVDLNPRPATGQSYMWFNKDNNNNAGVLEIVNPTYPFCNGNESVKVRIMNFGKNRLNSVVVNWEIDGIAQSPVAYTSLIDTFGSAAGYQATVTLGNVNFNKPHTLKVYTSLPNGNTDVVKKNDTLVQYITPSPTAAITASGQTIFCTAGAVNVTLNASPGSGNVYQWMKNGQPIPGANNSSYTATLAGDYTVKIDSNGCSNTTDITRVDNLAIPLPIVTPSGYVSLCDSITMISNAGITGASYQWQYQGVDIPGATSASYTASAPGNYTVITSKFTCTSTSPGINLIATAKPNPTIAQTNLTLSTDPTYTSYQWRLDGNNIPGANLFAYTPVKNGNYSVFVSNGSCTALSDTVEITEVGIDQLSSRNNNINVYPNPVSSILYIDAPKGYTITISSTEGKTLLTQILQNKEVNVEKLPAGLYVLRITDEKGFYIQTNKLTKKE